MSNTLSRSLLSLCAFSGLMLQAQNLVPNPSFDDQEDCPAVSEIELALPWYAPSNGTPDLFNGDCPTQNHPGHTGPGNAGVFVHGEGAFANYREYVQAQLISPLVAGNGYCVSVWVKRANMKYASDRFGVLLSEDPVNLTNTAPLPYVPQVENPAGSTMNAAGWQQISGGFVAEGNEQYVTIGSFSGSTATNAVVVNAASSSTSAYYYFDDVVVAPCNVSVAELTAPAFEVFPQPAQEGVTVRFALPVQVRDLRVIDTKGAVVLRPAAPVGERNTLEMQLHGLPEGSYRLVVTTDNAVLARPLLIVR